MKTINKKKIFIFFMSITFCSLINAQTTIVLQPDSNTGKDSYLRDLSPNDNYGNHPDFVAHAWTSQGDPVTVRGVIDFDLSGIPNGATINSASLSLYSYDSPSNGPHSTLSGSNESVLSRVTTFWDENTVTWNNQPSTTNQNQVFLPASTNPIQDYSNIDVTGMVQDMVADPSNSYGFLFKQATEQYYRRMLFSSSDNPDSNLHPKLEVCYSMTNSISESNNTNMEFNIFPNPTSNHITIDLSHVSQKLVSIDIMSSSGQIIERKNNVQSTIVIDVTNYSKGLYFVKVNFNDSISTKKMIIE